jgi:transposase
MTNGRVEVITSVERRRRWSAAEKEQLVAASLEPGASVSAIAREAGIHPGQLYGWRRQLRVRQGIGFAPVRIAAEVAPADLAAAARSRSSLRAERGCGSWARSTHRR